MKNNAAESPILEIPGKAADRAGESGTVRLGKTAPDSSHAKGENVPAWLFQSRRVAGAKGFALGFWSSFGSTGCSVVWSGFGPSLNVSRIAALRRVSASSRAEPSFPML